MKLSEQWLREWVDPPVSTDELAERLTTAGLEVAGVEPVAGPQAGIVVGEVLSVAPHPNADKLRVCKVHVGQEQPLDIVCGAPNVREGMRAPTALVGAELAGGMKIKKAKLRGVESFGMLCSGQELGIEENSEGLLALPQDAPVGEAIGVVLNLDDVSIDLDLTPNRGDCLGIAGIAREVGVIYRCSVNPPDMPAMEPAVTDEFPVEITAPADCPRYVGRVIRNVDPSAPTPLWMQERLRRSGLRSISAIVDVTNYLLLELGQPMHAFDLEKLAGGIQVRRATQGEGIALLDGTELTLDADSLVIADGNGPVALAGIMGGLSTAVSEQTRHIFLESAHFTPTAISGRARRYGLATDSSHRFERGVDFALQRRAVERATALLLDIIGGEPGPVIDVSSDEHLPRRQAIGLRPERIERVLGMSVDPETVTEVMTRSGASVVEEGDRWEVTPPSFRFDLVIEADLIEEIARIVGYDNVPSVAPRANLEVRTATESRVELFRMRHLLMDRGYHEAITYSFVDPGQQAKIDPDEQPVRLSNPISADMAVMRTTLWTGLLKALAYNQNRQQGRVRLFESGLRFRRRDGATHQTPTLAGVVAGSPYPEQWGSLQRPLDFHDVKADVEALLGLSGEPDHFTFVPSRHPALHPGQAATVQRGDRQVGSLGALHPSLLKELDLTGPVYLFELDAELAAAGRVPKFEALSRFPAIRRDIAIIVDEGVTGQAVRECIGQASSDVLKKLELFDVYQGEGIDSGKKSLALGLILQAASRTLTDTEVDALVDTVVKALGRQLGADLRG